MARLTIARIAGDPAELEARYRESAQTMAGVGRDHGLLLHAAAVTEGGLLVVNVWPSPDGSVSAAADPRRLGTLAQHGLGPADVQKEHHEVIGLIVGERPAGGARSPA